MLCCKTHAWAFVIFLPGARPGTYSSWKGWTKYQDLALQASSKSCKASCLFQWEMWVNKIHQVINILIHFHHPDRMYSPKYLQRDQTGLSLCKFCTVLHRIRMSTHEKAVISHSLSVLLKVQKSEGYAFCKAPTRHYVLYAIANVFPQAFAVQTMQTRTAGALKGTQEHEYRENLPLCNGYVLTKC